MTARMFMKICVYMSAVILAGVLIGFWQYGIDISSAFLGTPWNSYRPHGRGEEAMVGILAFTTIVFGGLFLGGLMALLLENGKKEAGKDAGEKDTKTETK